MTAPSALAGFNITGNIPGLPDGTQILLLSAEGRTKSELASAVSDDGKFVLSGEVEFPSLAEMRIEPTNTEVGYSIDLMVENTDMTLSCKSPDLLPQSWSSDASMVANQANVIIKGGKAQEEFSEYQAFTLPAQAEAVAAHRAMYFSDDSKHASEEQLAALEQKMGEKEALAKKMEQEFVTSHPQYNISMLKTIESVGSKYSMTGQDLDRVLNNAKGTVHAARYAELEKAVESARKYTYGTKYTDIAMLDADKAKTTLASHVVPGIYNLFDFWASWCGPCRFAIPHVRSLSKQYSDMLNVCSVSIDSDEAAWRKAMDDEKMEWKQLWIPEEMQAESLAPYEIHSIPTLLLIDPDGNIVYGGHDPARLEAILTKAKK